MLQLPRFCWKVPAFATRSKFWDWNDKVQFLKMTSYGIAGTQVLWVLKWFDGHCTNSNEKCESSSHPPLPPLPPPFQQWWKKGAWRTLYWFISENQSFNPIHPNSDYHLTSPDHITSSWSIQGMRIQEMIARSQFSWRLYKFSLTAAWNKRNIPEM